MDFQLNYEDLDVDVIVTLRGDLFTARLCMWMPPYYKHYMGVNTVIVINGCSARRTVRPDNYGRVVLKATATIDTDIPTVDMGFGLDVTYGAVMEYHEG